MFYKIAYLDLLGYKSLSLKNNNNFREKFKKFSESFINCPSAIAIYENHYVKPITFNEDGFLIMSESNSDDDCENFLKICEMLSFRQLFSIINFRFTLRGFLFKKNGKKGTINNLNKDEITKINNGEKSSKYARIKIDSKAITSNEKSFCIKKNAICRVKSMSKSLYINPFYLVLSNSKNDKVDSFSNNFYISLKTTLNELYEESKNDEIKKVYKKYKWLALEFDKTSQKFNLAYKPIVLSKDIQYAIIPKNINKDSVNEFRFFCKNILNKYIDYNKALTKKECFNTLKQISKSDFSFKKLDVIDKEIDDLIPVNIYKIIYILIKLTFTNEIVRGNYIKELNKVFYELLISISIINKNSHSGYLLEKYKEDFAKSCPDIFLNTNNKKIFKFFGD